MLVKIAVSGERRSMAAEERVERRRHKRFRAQEGAFVGLGNHRIKLGEIIDISKGGLAFRYIDIGDRPIGTFELDISFKKTGFRLEKVPAKTISDLVITKDFPYSSTKMRRQGVQFGELTVKQITLLDHFISEYTIAEA